MLFNLPEETRTYVLMLVSVFDSAEGILSALLDSLKLFVSLSTR
jgi:hypothetical protein